jgi:hypothetical protein
VAFALAAVALGHAMEISNGNLHPDSVFWLSVALPLALVGIAAPTHASVDRFGERAAAMVLAGGVAFQLTELLTVPPAMYLRPGPGGMVPFVQALAVLGVVSGAALAASGRFKHLVVAALLLAWLSLGVWLLHASPSPVIDVFVFQRDASRTLLRGMNPYSMTFPDIYGNSPYYGPGLSVGGRLQFGFPYPPLSLFLALGGYVSAGDYRYAQLVAMAGAAVLMAYARGGRVGVLAAAVFLLTPRVLFVLEQGWTEPYAVFLLALTVFAALRFPKAMPYALGLLLAVKQYTVLMVPLTLLLLPRPWRLKDAWNLLWRAGAVVLAVSLPLILWDVPAFVRSAITLQFAQPFRTEALSYLAWWARDGSPPLSPSLSLVAALLAIGVSLWRAPRTPAGFAGAVALTCCAFFAFNKQAFCNYYYLVVGSLCVAVAAAEPTWSRVPVKSAGEPDPVPAPPAAASPVAEAP